MLVTLLIFLLILSVLVLIHEFGHFLAAKKFGIKIEEFGFGIPPRAFGIKRGETIYSINWLPIGGFVKLYGEDEAGAGKISVKIKDQRSKTKDIDRAFFARPAWQRIIVVIAGVVMNFFLAAFIFYIFLYLSNFKTEILLLTDYKFLHVNQVNKNIDGKDNIISIVSPNSPAEKAGIQPPSELISINGIKIQSRKQATDLINKNKGKEITVVWQEIKSGKEKRAKVTPRISPPKNEGPFGVGFVPIAFLNYETGSQKLLSGFTHPINLTGYQLNVLGELIGVSVKEKSVEPVGQSVSGPLGIYVLVGKVLEIPDIKEKILTVLNLSGLISITLAFFNVLPIPALDGGRLAFILIEVVFRKKISAKYESLIHSIFFALLLALIILVTLKDIPMFLKFITGE